MAQPFDCLCGAPTCRGQIAGAGHMAEAQLEGLWLNGHIHELLAERKAARTDDVSGNGTVGHVDADPTAQALRDALQQAEKVVVATRAALTSYVQGAFQKPGRGVKALGASGLQNGAHGANGLSSNGSARGSQRRGLTSRELSGEMGGDTN